MPNKTEREMLGWPQQSQQPQADEPDDVGYAGYDDEPEQQQQPIAFNPTPIFNPLKLLKTGASVLSKMEAEAIRPFLIDGIRFYSDEADKFISATNRAHTVISVQNDNLIWSSLDDDEIATLADGLLIIGQRQKHVAQAIREVARTWKMVQAGLILGPKFIATMRFYADNGGIALW